MLHEHGTESQCDGGEDNHGEECDCDHSGIFLMLVLLFFLTAKIGPILVPCKFFSHFLHQI